MSNYLESVTFSALGVDKAERDIRKLDRALKSLVATSNSMTGAKNPFTGFGRDASAAARGSDRLGTSLRAAASEANRARSAIDALNRAAGKVRPLDPMRGYGGKPGFSASGRPAGSSSYRGTRDGANGRPGRSDAVSRLPSPTGMARTAEIQAERHRLAMDRTARQGERDAAKHAATLAAIGDQAAVRKARTDAAMAATANRAAREEVRAARLRAQNAVMAGNPGTYLYSNPFAAGGSGGRGGGRGRGPHGFAYVPTGGPHGGGIGVGPMTIPGALAIHAVGSIAVHAAHAVIHGALEGGKAREKLFQQGADGEGMRRADTTAQSLFDRYHLPKSDALRLVQEAQTFTHDPKVVETVSAMSARNNALASGTGEREAAEKGNLALLKALDLKGLLRPDPKTHEINTAPLQTYNDAIQRILRMEGKNVRPEDFRGLMARGGSVLSSTSSTGLQRLMLQASDTSGDVVGTQVSSLDEALRGKTKKATTAALLREGFIERTTNGGVRAKDFASYLDDPTAWTRRHVEEGMRRQKLDPTNPQHVKAYTDSLGLTRNPSRFLQGSVNRGPEMDRQLEIAGHARIGDDDAATTANRSLAAAMDQAKASVERYGTDLENSRVGELTREAINGFRAKIDAFGDAMFKPDADGKKPGIMAGAIGAGAFGLAAATKYAIENPGQAANTAALGGLTAAVAANTAAQGRGTLASLLGGGGLPGAAGGAVGTASWAARILGIGGTAVGLAALGYGTYKGSGYGQSEQENRATADIARLRSQVDTLESVAAGKASRGEDASGTTAKIEGLKAEITAAMKRLEVATADREAGRTRPYVAEAQDSAKAAVDGALKRFDDVATKGAKLVPTFLGMARPPAETRREMLGRQLADLRRDEESRRASVPGASPGELASVLGNVPSLIASVRAEIMKIDALKPGVTPGGSFGLGGPTMPEAKRVPTLGTDANGGPGGTLATTLASFASSATPIADALKAGALTFQTAADSLPGKGSEFGTTAGAGILGVAGAFGATVAGAISAAAANVTVSVTQAAAPNTGSAGKTD